jgi:GTP:adenosylcobinamide-phosphate guanylyltransferase
MPSDAPAHREAPATALLLAGRRGGLDTLADATGASHRALVAVDGVPMLQRVVDTLLGWRLETVVASTDAPALVAGVPRLAALAEEGKLRLRSSAGSPAASVLDFLDDSAAVRWPCLVTTADHALLTLEMLDAFWAGVARTDADLAVGVVEEPEFRARFPHLRRTFVRLADVSVKAVNLFAFLTPKAAAVPAFWRRVERDRKRPWRLVRAFGVPTLLSYASGRLTLERALERVRATTGARVALVPLRFAEAAIDVDRVEDLDVARDVLARRRRAGPLDRNADARLANALG